MDVVRIIASPKPRNRFTRMFGLTWKAFRLALRERADVYHFHDPELLPIGVLLKLVTKAKVIYDVHENVPHQILTKYWIPKLLRRPIAEVVNFRLLSEYLGDMFRAMIEMNRMLKKGRTRKRT